MFPPFNVTEAAVGSRWKKWLGRLEIMLIGMDVKDAKCKRALLLHYAGEDVYDILTTLPQTAIKHSTLPSKHYLSIMHLRKVLNSKCTSFDRQSKNLMKTWTVSTPDSA